MIGAHAAGEVEGEAGANRNTADAPPRRSAMALSPTAPTP